MYKTAIFSESRESSSSPESLAKEDPEIITCNFAEYVGEDHIRRLYCCCLKNLEVLGKRMVISISKRVEYVLGAKISIAVNTMFADFEITMPS